MNNKKTELARRLRCGCLINEAGHIIEFCPQCDQIYFDTILDERGEEYE